MIRACMVVSFVGVFFDSVFCFFSLAMGWGLGSRAFEGVMG
jgi:hypothetical protein